MESSESNLKISRGSYLKNPKANNGKGSNSTSNKSFSQNNTKRKNNKQIRKNYDANYLEARNISISDRIASAEALNSSSSEFALLILVLIGNEVELKLVDCQVYRGIFHSISKCEGSNEQYVCIRYCRKILDLFSNELSKPIEDYCMFPLSSVYRLSTTNTSGIPTRFDSISGELNDGKINRINSFRTDNEIGSEDRHTHERILQPWVSEDHNSDIVEEVLGSEPFDRWDQFEENHSKFGVKGTYDENLYTTPLNYSEISEEEKRKAEILASEIEREQKKDSFNNLENEIIDSPVENEEEMHFSSVYRNVSSHCVPINDVNNELQSDSVELLNRSNTIEKNNKIAETSNNDSNSNNRKSKFSFNPNAKEFLPRTVYNNLEVSEDQINKCANIRVNETISNSCKYQNYSTYLSQRNEHFAHSSIHKQHYHNNQFNHNSHDNFLVSSEHANGAQFMDGMRDEANNEILTNQISYGEYYSSNNHLDSEVCESSKDAYQYSELSPDVSNMQAIYYYSAEPGNVQNAAYYISDYNTVKWSNYSINNQYYVPNNNSEIYKQYYNYQSQGTYY